MSAKEVKKIRDQLGLTQSQLADKLGVEQAAVCMWERGKRNPSGTVIILLRTLAGMPQKKINSSC